MTYRLSIGSVLLVFVCGCSSPASVQNSSQGAIEGTWQQTFLYSPGPGSAVRVYPIGVDTPPEYKTARLTFGDSVFTWVCVPTEQYLDGHVLGDPLAGRYEVVGNQLRLLGYSAPNWDEFSFSGVNDTLRISIAAVPSEGGFMALPAYSWLWGNSLGRTEGTFLRVRE